mmetsp:Transcript_36842/g.55640  ORF Transcript_36842/g.55640 Transcript_36842/m.55640 type:complete len:221 (+) Transcript_36842:95-757(+)
MTARLLHLRFPLSAIALFLLQRATAVVFQSAGSEVSAHNTLDEVGAMSEGKSVEEGKDSDMSHLEEEDEEDEDEDVDDEKDEDHDDDIDHADHQDDGAKLLATEEGRRSLLMRREADNLTLDDDKKKTCSYGQYLHSKKCHECQGEVRRRRDEKTCTSCQAGYIPQSKSDKCVKCKGGKVVNNKCNPCGKGYYSPKGIECLKCDKVDRRRRHSKKCTTNR